MNRRIETRAVDTGGVAGALLISKDASEVWWITVSNKSTNHANEFLLYDGFDAGGKLKWILESIESATHNFVPPIPCEQGVYVVWSDRVYSFTIAWRPKKWDRAKPMKADVITHPEA